MRGRRRRTRRPILSGHALPLRPRACASAAWSRLLLGSVVLDDNGAMIVDLANADLHDADGQDLAAARFASMSAASSSSAAQPATNASGVRRFDPVGRPIPIEIELRRRFRRPVRGARRATATARHADGGDGRRVATVRFAYVGLDDVPAPTTLALRSAARLDLTEPSGALGRSISTRPIEFDLVDRRRIARSTEDAPAEPPHILPRLSNDAARPRAGAGRARRA